MANGVKLGVARQVANLWRRRQCNAEHVGSRDTVLNLVREGELLVNYRLRT